MVELDRGAIPGSPESVAGSDNDSGSGSGSDSGIRAALIDGLREEAAPISRRLAEVKGLTNNAIRRLEGIEALVESERNARVDDLALLVDLLTEGWRALDVRLARIETALDRQPSNVVSLRESA